MTKTGGRSASQGADRPCSCGNRNRPNINHRVRVPCWTYIGHDKYDVVNDADVYFGYRLEPRAKDG